MNEQRSQVNRNKRSAWQHIPVAHWEETVFAVGLRRAMPGGTMVRARQAGSRGRERVVYAASLAGFPGARESSMPQELRAPKRRQQRAPDPATKRIRYIRTGITCACRFSETRMTMSQRWHEH